MRSSRAGGARKRIALIAGVIALLALPVLVSQASALTADNPPPFTFVNDENGADDQPGQKDLNSQAVATPAPGDLWVSWKWDVTSLSGGNTGDACALFDTDADSKVNFAVCVTIAGNPATQSGVSPRVYTCGDGKVDRCTSTYAQVSPIQSACSTNTNASDFYHSGQKDTQAICHIALSDVGGAGTAQLVNTCSYPSQQPTSDPSDCVLIPRDAFLKVTKSASPNDSTVFNFRHAVTGQALPAISSPTFTVTGSGTTSYVAIRSDTSYFLKEDIPSNWALTGASCTGASGSGSSNGTRGTGTSADTITGIDASPDNQITCTFTDVKQTGAIRIIKQDKDTSAKLGGAVFSIGSTTGLTTSSVNDATKGTVCKDGLALGNHTVTETAAPNGYSKDPASPKTVNVDTAGTCASGAKEVTFNDAVVPGKIVVRKTDAAGDGLAGATFTLYKDVDPTDGATVPTTADLATVTNKSCTTAGGGDNMPATCEITGVALGDYWVVETGVPNGYVKAPDQHVTVILGNAPETGQTITLDFGNDAAAGTIVITKTGDGGPLAGATFQLWTDADPLIPGYTPAPLGDDEYTGNSCVSLADGTCTLLSVAPGHYWLVESVTPKGYATVDPEPVNVPINTGGSGGAEVELTLDDPVVPGSVTVHKTGVDAEALDGAGFTLYVDADPEDTYGDEDDEVAGTCTTGDPDVGSGECTIGDVAPGKYWLVETVTPNGYKTADAEAVEVHKGSAANAGDDVTINVEDEAVPGTVSITKKDDAGNVLEGAEFTLFDDNPTVGGQRGGAQEDPETALKCTTDVAGKCDITDVPLGNYWVVETVTPDHYDTAADAAIEVKLGTEEPNKGATVSVTRVDPRQHRIVVLVCHEGTDSLYESDVTVDGETKQSLSGAGLDADEEAALCNAGGASFGDIGEHPDDVAAHVDLSSPGH